MASICAFFFISPKDEGGQKLVKVEIRKPLGYFIAGNYGKEFGRWQASSCLCQSVLSTLEEHKALMDR